MGPLASQLLASDAGLWAATEMHSCCRSCNLRVQQEGRPARWSPGFAAESAGADLLVLLGLPAAVVVLLLCWFCCFKKNRHERLTFSDKVEGGYGKADSEFGGESFWQTSLVMCG